MQSSMKQHNILAIRSVTLLQYGHMKKQLLFWVPNALLLLVMVGSGIMYFLKPVDIAAVFTQLGYPVYTMYFNATAKILGGIAIVLPVFPRFLKEFAYAGYLYIILLATQAVMMTSSLAQSWFMVIFIAIWAWAYWAFRAYKAR